MSNEKLMETMESKKQSPMANFRDLLEKNRGQLVSALPRHLNADRMIRLVCTEFSKNPKLLECDIKSIFGAIIQASQLGLEIGVLGQAYLIPFWNKKRGIMECQCIPGYKGLIGLARRSGEMTSLETHIVYAKDKFEMILGIESSVKHEPDYLTEDRGLPTLVYGVAKFKDGGHHFEWMTLPQINKIRDKSLSKVKAEYRAYSIWNTDYEQMIRKTLIRRMANYLPMSIELQSSIQMLDAFDQGKNTYIDAGIVMTQDSDGSDHSEPEQISQDQEEMAK